MPILELSRDEYLATMKAPMHRLSPQEMSNPVPIGDYIAQCVQAHQLSAGLDEVDIENVYLNGDQDYIHVVLAHGEKHQRLVIIIDQQAQKIYGHYRLDLAAEYGLNKTGR